MRLFFSDFAQHFGHHFGRQHLGRLFGKHANHPFVYKLCGNLFDKVSGNHFGKLSGNQLEKLDKLFGNHLDIQQDKPQEDTSFEKRFDQQSPRQLNDPHFGKRTVGEQSSKQMSSALQITFSQAASKLTAVLKQLKL